MLFIVGAIGVAVGCAFAFIAIIVVLSLLANGFLDPPVSM